MKVLLAVGSAAYGGTEKQVINLAKELSILETEVTIAFMNRLGPLVEEINNSKVSYVNLGFQKKNIFNNFKSLLAFVKFLNTQQFDVINAFLAEAIILTWVARTFSRKKSLFISGVRGIFFSDQYILKCIVLPFYYYILNKSGLIICNSIDLIKHIKTKVHNTRIIHIPNGVEVPPYKIRTHQEKINVVVIANFYVYKGYDLLFESLKYLNQKFDLHLIGSGTELAKYINLAREIKSNEIDITFHGTLSPAEMKKILEKCDFAIHPSRTEGLSNAIMEELSYGLPVVAFDVGGNSELVTNLHNGILVEPFKTEIMSKAIDLLIENITLRKTMQKNALGSIQTFSFKTLGYSYLQNYLKQLNQVFL